MVVDHAKVDSVDGQVVSDLGTVTFSPQRRHETGGLLYLWMYPRIIAFP